MGKDEMTESPARTFHADRSSFRDPDGAVFHSEGRIFRMLRNVGAQRYRELEKSGLLAELVSAKLAVPTTVALDVAPLPGFDMVLEHERIPAISYPYEWPFSMLSSAADATLEIQRRALARGFILKDATPYNIQFRAGAPVLIDIPSLLPHHEGEPWEGYAQFCSLFLFPLMLAAYAGTDFRPFLRGSIAGVSAYDASMLLGLRSIAKPGVFMHVFMQSMLERKFNRAGGEIRSQFSASTFPRSVVERQCAGLRKCIAGMTTSSSSHWLRYEEDGDAAYRDKKTRFVVAAVGNAAPSRLIDLGANTGFMANACAASVKEIVAVDADAACVDRIYRRVAAGEYSSKILPLAVNLTDVSPSMGWRLAERPSFTERCRGDMFLALALIHHLSITGNIPLFEIMAWLKDIAPRGVVEYVAAEDPRAHELLSRKSVAPPDYTTAGFETACESAFRIVRKEVLPGGTRIIYELDPR